jgi:23S rRNA pseudouridine2604 synthase
MSELGLCSRREADVFIAGGMVRVNGEVVDELGSKVTSDDRIELERAGRLAQDAKPTVLLHKPIGIVSSQPEPGYRPAIDLISPHSRWYNDPNPQPFGNNDVYGLAAAGRLDIESSGLLVLTSDGRVARQIIDGGGGVEKEYLVRVDGYLSTKGLQMLRYGLRLDGKQLRPADVDWQNEDQLRFVLREGRKRQIRRMCELVGLDVIGLKRVRIGEIRLGSLPLGEWRLKSEDEAF